MNYAIIKDNKKLMSNYVEKENNRLAKVDYSRTKLC